MYREESSFHKQNIRYHIVESPAHESRKSFLDTDCPNDSIRSCINDNDNNKHNETLMLAFHSSLLCFKIALCVLI